MEYAYGIDGPMLILRALAALRDHDTGTGFLWTTHHSRLEHPAPSKHSYEQDSLSGIGILYPRLGQIEGHPMERRLLYIYHHVLSLFFRFLLGPCSSVFGPRPLGLF